MNKYLKIEGNQWGFFSSFIETLDNLRWCDLNNIEPIVQYRLRRGTNNYDYGYESAEPYNGSTNPWEYYFETIPETTVEGTIIQTCFDNQLMKEIPISFGYRNHGTSGLKNKKGHWPTVREDDDRMRKEANRIIQKYVKIKPQVQEKVDKFVDTNMKGKHTIALHVRGGRGAKETQRKNNVKLEHYCAYLKEYLKELDNDNFVIYVASDTTEGINFMKDNLPNVIYYPCRRTDNHYIPEGMPYHQVKEMTCTDIFPNERAQVGEEALLECLLMSKCDVMFHHESLLACAATYFNLDMETYHIETYLSKNRL